MVKYDSRSKHYPKYPNKDNPRRKNKKRKPYRKSRRFDASCRNHGDCTYCQNGRHHKFKRQDFSEIE